MKTNKANVTTYKLVVTAAMLALATVLNEFTSFESPFLMGGGVTVFSQVPIIALSWIFGVPWGLCSGFVFSVIQALIGIKNIAYAQTIGGYIIAALFDYIVSYTMLGLAGIFKGKIKNAYAALATGSLLVCVIRLCCHIITGVTIWKAYCPEDMTVLGYSVVYNASYMIPETIITIIGILALAKFFFPRVDENGMIKS